jgi:poly-gamma-glutamate capsule biosynthesis protein CapA/YwtB (metallophosphatase superfamily)
MVSPGGSEPGRARVTFLGDTLIGGEGQHVVDERGAPWALDAIRDLFVGSDLVVANLEGPVTDRQEPEAKLDTGRKRYWYRARVDSLHALRDAGVRVVGLANNHVLDFGADGLADTIRALEAAGIAHCGAGPNRRSARAAAVVDAGGLRLAFLAAMQRYDIYVRERLYAARSRPGPLRLRLDRLRSDLESIADDVDATVALVHWGRNYRRVNPRQQRLAGEIVAAGADLVIGHHPHVPQPVTLVRGVPVCFSLGNGPLGTPGRFHSGRPPYGLVVTVDLESGGRRARPVALAVTPIHVDNAVVGFQPRVADDRDARRVLRRLLSGDLAWDREGPTWRTQLCDPRSDHPEVGAGPQAAGGRSRATITARSPSQASRCDGSSVV